MKRTFVKTSLAASIGLAITASLAQAEENTAESNLALEEVVVTAQKREQNLQDTPIAIAAYDQQAIEDQQVYDIADVTTSAPNVQIAPSPGGSTGATVTIRGASMINPAVTWEPAVGIYVDGVFVAKNIGGLFDVAELERIEVLRGPQGTLYGKNTTGGAINLITRKPAEEFGGKVKLGAGNYNYTEAALSLDTGKLADLVSVNIAYNKRDRDGFYENTSATADIDEFKKLDSEAGKVSALFDVSDAVEIYYNYDWSKRDNTVAFGQPEMADVSLNLPAPYREDSGALDGAGVDQSESSGHSLHITWDINDDLTLKSITAQREMSFDDYNDYDGNDSLGFHTERHVEHDQVSQEFQLIGRVASINYVAGLYFFDDDSDAANPYNFGIILRNFYGVETQSTAIFGQADWAATDALTLTAGVRWTYEEKDAYVKHPDDPYTPYSAEMGDDWTNVSPMIAVSYAINDDVTTYAKVSKGWKSGGFNAEAATPPEAVEPYDEEVLTAYELGLKARFLDNRVQTNIALFKNDIEDMQISSYDSSTGYSKVANAGEAEIQGLELEAIWMVTEEFTAYLNYGYLDPEYKDYVDPVSLAQLKDVNKFVYSPENKVALGLEYVSDVGFGELRARVDYSYTDEQYFYNDLYSAMVTAADSYSLINARVAITDMDMGDGQSLEMGAWVKNLTDEEYRVNGIPSPTALEGLNYYGDPRTVGIDVTYSF